MVHSAPHKACQPRSDCLLKPCHTSFPHALRLIRRKAAEARRASGNAPGGWRHKGIVNLDARQLGSGMTESTI